MVAEFEEIYVLGILPSEFFGILVVDCLVPVTQGHGMEAVDAVGCAEFSAGRKGHASCPAREKTTSLAWYTIIGRRPAVGS